jgi:hypothetical protein
MLETKMLSPNPNFEYGRYAHNLDIYESYSDDESTTWSTPVKINDDVGDADQYFVSGSVDDNGVLHVAWVDRRNTMATPSFDVYYSYSSDGKTFAPNTQINETPTSILGPMRPFGDYLQMVVAKVGGAYIQYPCGTTTVDACFAEVSDNVTPPPPITSLSLSGTISYFKGSAPVQGVTVTATANDGSTQTTATDANGLYTFSNLPAGKTWTVVPSKTESVVSGISPMDAVLIMQQMKKTISLSPLEILASDVIAMGRVAISSASFILRFAVGKIAKFPAG